MKPLTKEQAQQLLTALHGHNMEALFVLALTAGMRRGEILALKWQDIDFDQNTLQVRRIFTRSKGHRYVLAEPKTEKSRPSAILPSITVDLLKQHRMTQQQAKSQAGEHSQATDLASSTPLATHLHPTHLLN